MNSPAEVTDAPQGGAAKPPRKKRPRRVRHKATGKKVIPFTAPEEFAGMTALECCGACSSERCVLSEVAFCAHPLKASFHSSDTVIVARIERAKKVLKHQKIDIDRM